MVGAVSTSVLEEARDRTLSRGTRHTERMPDFITWLTAGFDVFMQLARLTLDYLKILAWPAVVLILALAFRKPLIGVLTRLHKASGLGMNIVLTQEFADNAREIVEDLEESPKEAVDEKPSSPPAQVNPTSPPAQVKPTSPPAPVKHRMDALENALKIEPITVEDLRRSNDAFSHTLKIEPITAGDFRHRNLVLGNGLRLRDPAAEQMINYGRIIAAWTQLERTAKQIAEAKKLTGQRTVRTIARKLQAEHHISDATVDAAADLQDLYNRIRHELGNALITDRTAEDFVAAAARLESTFRSVPL